MHAYLCDCNTNVTSCIRYWVVQQTCCHVDEGFQAPWTCTCWLCLCLDASCIRYHSKREHFFRHKRYQQHHKGNGDSSPLVITSVCLWQPWRAHLVVVRRKQCLPSHRSFILFDLPFNLSESCDSTMANDLLECILRLEEDQGCGRCAALCAVCDPLHAQGITLASACLEQFVTQVNNIVPILFSVVILL